MSEKQTSGNGRPFRSDFGIIRILDVRFLDVDCISSMRNRTMQLLLLVYVICSEVEVFSKNFDGCMDGA